MFTTLRTESKISSPKFLGYLSKIHFRKIIMIYFIFKASATLMSTFFFIVATSTVSFNLKILFFVILKKR